GQREGGVPIKAGAGSILPRYHAFGYRRRIPGRHRHCRSRPSRPDARLTALPLLEDEPAPPASLMAHWDLNHRFDRRVTGPGRHFLAAVEVRGTFGPCGRNAIKRPPPKPITARGYAQP